MKIGLVSAYDWSVPGGVNSHILHLANEFTAAGHDVRIIAPSSAPAGLDSDPRLIFIGKPRSIRASGSIARITFSFLRKSKRVRHVLDEEQFDVVHLHEPLIPSLTFLFLRQAECLRIGTFHAARDGGHLVYSYGRRIIKRWFRRLDGKIAVSVAANRLIGRYFPGYYNIIPNGIDVERFSGEAGRLAEFDDGRLNVLFVGRLEKRKGLKYLLRAFVAFKAEHPSSRLIVVGEGKLRSGYAKSMQKAGVSDVVFTGFVPDADLPRYYASADICCAPATGHESFGIVLLEAMASGKPVIASNIEGYAAVVTHGVEGLLVPPKDAAALLTALQDLAVDPGLRERMGERGRGKAQEFGWERVAQRVLSYYERLLYERQEFRQSQERQGESEAIRSSS